MIMGELCTRRCPFCDVAHGRPAAPGRGRAASTSRDAVAAMGLRVRGDHVGGPGRSPRRRRRATSRPASPASGSSCPADDASRSSSRTSAGAWTVPSPRSPASPPDVLNHNLETVPRLYRKARPGADYAMVSQICSRRFKRRASRRFPPSPGLMLGLGEEARAEVERVLRGSARARLRNADPRAVPAAEPPPSTRRARYWEPAEFESLGAFARGLGFTQRRERPAGAFLLSCGSSGGRRDGRLSRGWSSSW